MIHCATLHGLSQKIGDKYASASTKCGPEQTPVEWAINEADTMIRNIMAGLWAAEKAAGVPRIDMLLDAIETVAGDAGLEFDREAVRVMLVDEETGKNTCKEFKADADVRAAFDELVADAAKAKAAKSKEAAAGKESSLAGLLS
jgi:hypothetical protein